MSPLTGRVLVIDTSTAALAEITTLRQAATPRELRNATAWPPTTVLALPGGGERRIFALPPGAHVPLTEMAPGIMLRSCDVSEARDGCATTDRSDRSVAPAPQFVLDRFAAAAPDDAAALALDAPAVPENAASGPPGGTTPEHKTIPDTATELASENMPQAQHDLDEIYAELIGNADASRGKVLCFPSSPSIAPADAGDALRQRTAAWPPVELTLWENAAGPCSKHIKLRNEGIIASSSDCKFTGGSARRIRLTDLPGATPHHALAELIRGMASNQMLTAGRLIVGIGDTPHVVTKKHLGGQLNTVARSKDFVRFAPGEPAPLLIDYDQKEMPYTVRTRIADASGPWEALVSAVPALTGIGRVVRQSTSSGIRNAETGEEFPGSGGMHIYVLVADGGDIKRGLDVLHDRAWLAGLGWYLIGKAGHLYERSIVDCSVAAAEHPIFEGAPVVVPPLVQDLTARQPAVYEGAVLDTVALLADLTEEERAKVDTLKAAARARIQPEADSVQESYARMRADQRAEKEGVSPEDAYAQIKDSLRDRRLMPWMVLEFDDGSAATVQDVVTDLAHYAGKTGPDPYEGPEYGACKFQVYSSGMAHSFAHGGATYKLMSEAMLGASGFENTDGADKFSMEWWERRDLPPPDRLMGEWLTTTSRVLIHAPTGVGKTMLNVALSAASAAGREFLHWKGIRPASVLYIDGEMAPRLLKDRVIGEGRRMGEMTPNLKLVNRLDMGERFKPLNTKAGQDVIEALLKKIGKIDLIVFDNIKSLLVGDAREETSWSPIESWLFDLTSRNIGQIWVHHTGYDESRGYGASTREWHMDTVIHLDREKRPDTDVSFKLSFTKARERTPATRQDFVDLTVALVNDTWQWSSDKGQGTGKITPTMQSYLEALQVVAAANPESVAAPFRFSNLDAWREECFRTGLVDRNKPDSARSMFSQYVRKLVVAKCVAVDDELVQVLT